MKKRLIGLMTALALLLSAAAATAAAPLTLQEIVDRVVVPMALENDTGDAGITLDFSHKQLAEIVRVMEENGITLPENNTVMQYVTSGCGYYESSVVGYFCDQVFGPSDTWTDEEQSWYDGLEVRMGHTEEQVSHVPGKDNMTREEAVAWALRKIREEHGENLPLENPDIWRMSVRFTTDYPTYTGVADAWSVSLTPKDIGHARYDVSFVDADPEGTTELYYMAVNPDDPHTLFQLQSSFDMIYGQNKDWSQSVWQAYHEMLQQTELNPEDYDYINYVGYRMTGYPEPEANEIPREEAIRIAKEAMTNKRAAYNSAVLTEYEGERAWLVSFVILTPFSNEGEPDEEAGYYTVSIDSATGEVRSLRTEGSYEQAICYIPEKAYRETRDLLPKEEDLLPLAVEAARKAYPEAGDPLDGENYSYFSVMIGRPFVKFTALNLQHSDITVRFTPEGEVRDVTMDPPTDGDNLFSRYYSLHGSMPKWDQSVWVQLEKDMKELEPEGIEGKVLKATHYPEESSVTIKHEEARKLGRETTGKRLTEVNSCVLVDAKPHPVWIVNLLTDNVLSIVGIDAETGETVFTLPDRADFSPRYMGWSMPETWRKIEMEEIGPVRLAQAAVIDRVFPADIEWRSYTPDSGASWHDYIGMNTGFLWDNQVNGLTVRFISFSKDVDSYEVELDENGNVIRFEEIKAKNRK